jgi:Ca2+-binding RTX toxin-like protein
MGRGSGQPSRRRGAQAALAFAVALFALAGLPPAAGAAGTVIHNGNTTVTTITDGAQRLEVFVQLTDCEIGGQPATCDEFHTSSGNLVPRGLCADDGFGNVICPQGDSYVANLGAGSDSINWSDDLYYNSFTADGGPGEDSIYGADRRVAGFANRMVVRGGTGEDNLYGGPGPDTLRGGGSRDDIQGFAGNDRLFGDAGHEFTLEGGPGRDRINGGAGGDSLDAGQDPGGDTFIGGPGNDRLYYSILRNAGVKISLDRRPNDGGRGERDNIGNDIEEIVGSEHRDVLTGNGDANTLYGGGGNDTIIGGAGNDRLIGGDDDDTVIGGSGRDSIFGDGTECGSGCDTGNDTIRAVDGDRDLISCGPSADVAFIDRIDTVARDLINTCERIRR